MMRGDEEPHVSPRFLRIRFFLPHQADSLIMFFSYSAGATYFEELQFFSYFFFRFSLIPFISV
jgi:hypothetical protein